MIISKNRAAIFAGLILVLVAVFAVNAQDVRRISKDELKAELGKPNLLVLDVRSPHDWDASSLKIEGSLREDPSKVDEWKDKYPKEKITVLYCA